jgi:hypothetical protein
LGAGGERGGGTCEEVAAGEHRSVMVYHGGDED